jgi:hypothetical protein
LTLGGHGNVCRFGIHSVFFLGEKNLPSEQRPAAENQRSAEIFSYRIHDGVRNRQRLYKVLKWNTCLKDMFVLSASNSGKIDI